MAVRGASGRPMSASRAAPIGLGFGSVGGSIDAADLYEVAKFIKKFGATCTQALGEAIYDEATAIIEDAKENYVPEESGRLKDSGRVSALTIEDDNALVEIGFCRPPIISEK